VAATVGLCPSRGPGTLEAQRELSQLTVNCPDKTPVLHQRPTMVRMVTDVPLLLSPGNPFASEALLSPAIRDDRRHLVVRSPFKTGRT
jgi:hypothetical protein